jgi:hypothetical protein
LTTLPVFSCADVLWRWKWTVFKGVCWMVLRHSVYDNRPSMEDGPNESHSVSESIQFPLLVVM